SGDEQRRESGQHASTDVHGGSPPLRRRPDRAASAMRTPAESLHPRRYPVRAITLTPCRPCTADEDPSSRGANREGFCGVIRSNDWKETEHESPFPCPRTVRPGPWHGDLNSGCARGRIEGLETLDGPVRHVELRLVVHREERFLRPGTRLPASLRGTRRQG